MAAFITNQSFDDVPLSIEAKMVALAGLVVFLLLITAYAASFREERERRIHRRLRNKPRFLPMQDHSLVVGDLSPARLILQQFQHYGRNQDIVVAGVDPATATVAGLDRLEPMVWAVEGNLRDQEGRRQATVERAAKLVLPAANLGSGEAWRTVARVEPDRPRMVTVVDARGCGRCDAEGVDLAPVRRAAAVSSQFRRPRTIMQAFLLAPRGGLLDQTLQQPFLPFALEPVDLHPLAVEPQSIPIQNRPGVEQVQAVDHLVPSTAQERIIL